MYLHLLISNSFPIPVPIAVTRDLNSTFCKALDVVVSQALKGIPFNSKISVVLISLASIAPPEADLPSTISNSRFPGLPVAKDNPLILFLLNALNAPDCFITFFFSSLDLILVLQDNLIQSPIFFACDSFFFIHLFNSCLIDVFTNGVISSLISFAFICPLNSAFTNLTFKTQTKPDLVSSCYC